MGEMGVAQRGEEHRDSRIIERGGAQNGSTEMGGT